MTGSIHKLNRQHSSTTTTATTTMEKGYRSKLRRSSSVDDQNSMELMPDINQQKEISVFKREYRTSDIDSGTEEIEQQMEHAFVVGAYYDNDDQLSTKSSGHNFDEGFSEYEREDEQQVQMENEDSKLPMIEEDLKLAETIPDEAKKDFCYDTSVAFHGEFARLIAVPLSLYYDCRFYLFAQEELDPEFFANIQFDCMKVDNVKAQFKCPNRHCQHAWTSMRARVLFSITNPATGYIVLKILGQNCQLCGTNADALWYIDEVCRVMKNLAKSLFQKYFPDMLNHVDLEVAKPIQYISKPLRNPNHDPTQRKGRMYAPHNKQFCEACRLGLCFG